MKQNYTLKSIRHESSKYHVINQRFAIEIEQTEARQRGCRGTLAAGEWRFRAVAQRSMYRSPAEATLVILNVSRHRIFMPKRPGHREKCRDVLQESTGSHYGSVYFVPAPKSGPASSSTAGVVDASVRAAEKLHGAYYVSNIDALPNPSVQSFYRQQNKVLDRFMMVPPASFYWTDEAPGRSQQGSGVGSETSVDNSTLVVDEERALVNMPRENVSDGEQRNEMVMHVSSWASHRAKRTGVEAAAEHHARQAIVLSNAANVILLFGQIYAYFATGSLSLLANTVDAVLDFLSGLIVAGTWYVRRYSDGLHTRYSYPIGRARLESVGVLVMAVFMTALTLNVFEQSLAALAAHVRWHDVSNGSHGNENPPLDAIVLTPLVVGVIAFALVTKIALYVVCRGSTHDAVTALATDHWNDCVSNIGAVSAASASRLWAPLDPLGGVLFSVLILRNWWSITSTHLDHLISRSAPSELYSVVTFAAMWHDVRIRAIDRVCLYHVGPACFAEVDILLDGQMPLFESHDIGESLQVRIESLQGIERCFVHLDFETEHGMEIEHKRPF